MTKVMSQVVNAMRQGTKLYTLNGRKWLDRPFETRVHHSTFWALCARKLIRPQGDRIHGIRCWELTDKGRDAK